MRLAGSGLSAEERISVMSRDGARLAVWRSGHGPPLVLVHGTTVTHTDWAPVLPTLTERFTCYAMDRRGVGASEDRLPYSLEREFEDIASVVDAIGKPALLMAHSFGALCSLEAALLTPNLRELVLYEPPIPTGPDFRPTDLTPRLEALLAAGQDDEVVATFLREVADQDERRVALQRRTRAWPARVATAPVVVREVVWTDHYDLRPERFARLSVPTLLLLGGASPPRHIRATRLVASSLADARIVELPGQLHIAMHTATQLFLDAVLGFLLEDM